MKIKQSLLIYIHFILLLVLSHSVKAQFHSENFVSTTPADSAKISINLDAGGFFHNNEFFSTDEEGYTLPGNYFLPSVTYRTDRDMSIGAGLYMLNFNGQDGFREILPVLYLKYNFAARGDILFGSFKGGDNHRLPESLYARETHFRNYIQNGILINYSIGKFSSRTWLDWEKYIEPGDPFREEFSFAFSSSYSMIENENENLSIPLYLLANHKGGQINNNNERVETIADISTGFIYGRKTDFLIFDELELSGLAFLESDIDRDEQGMAVSALAEVRGEPASAAVGYFYGNNWESIHGNPLLFCGDNNSVDNKSMILLKAGIAKAIGTGSHFSLRFEGYYDTRIQKMQYLYGLYLVVNEDIWKK